MKIVIFGLTISSTWGNGHATLWRGLCKALGRRGHDVVFYEHDVPYYSGARDLYELSGNGSLRLYSDWQDVVGDARGELNDATLAMSTSYCPDALAANELILDSRAEIKAFYDLDTPVTLGQLEQCGDVSYLPPDGLGCFDLVLSYTGGRALEDLQTRLGARRVAPLYGSVDPETHFPVMRREEFGADLSYMGTYAADRQDGLNELLLETARRLPERRFVIGGTQYPQDFPWGRNIYFVQHLPPALHPAFFCSARMTLNVTRRAMAAYGFCPSGRLFEAAACGVPIVTDWWEGLESFFAPGEELLRVDTARDVVEALQLEDAELLQMAYRARERVLTEHTAEHRVMELEQICAGM